MCLGRIGDEALRSFDQEPVLRVNNLCRDGRRVRAGIGLGQGESTYATARRQLTQVSRLLFTRAKTVNVAGAEREVGTVDGAGGCTAT